MMFVRREIWALEENEPFDPITLAYANAIKAMQDRPASDPTSWAFQGAIHGSYAVPPSGTEWNQCQHQGWYFLPWHRMYLYFFERIVRAAVVEVGWPENFALPYWNYDKEFPGNTIPIAFRTEQLPDDGTDNPLFLAPPRRNFGLMNGGQLDPTVTSPAAALSQSEFTSPTMGFGGGMVGPQHFGDFANTGALEQTPHNDIHVELVGVPPVGRCQGGFMIDPNCAGLDPIFWLHHANIDRLWNVWLTDERHVNPSDASWRGQRFVFYDEEGSEVEMTVEDVVDSAEQLGYVYDDVPSVEMGPPPPEEVPERASPPELVAATEEGLTLAGGPASVPLSVPEDTRGALESAAAPGPGRVLVSVDDIKAEVNPGVVYGVYLNLPGGGGDRQKHHVGNVSLFGIEKMNDPDVRHEGAPGFRHVFDATSVVGKLSEEGLWDPAGMTVTFEPIGVHPPPGAEAWEAGERPARDVPPIEIGRVSLFAA